MQVSDKKNFSLKNTHIISLRLFITALRNRIEDRNQQVRERAEKMILLDMCVFFSVLPVGA